MNISEIEKSLYRKIELTVQQKKAGISAVICGLIAHLYFMCNMILSDDTVSGYYNISNPYSNPFVGASSGRWLVRFSYYIISWYRPAFLCGFLIILCMAVMAMIIVDIYKINSSIGAIICGGLVVSFPSVLAFISLWDLGYALSVLLPVVAVYNVEKKKNVLLSVLLCGLGLSIMPINLMSVLVLNIYILLYKLLTEESITYERVWKPLVKQLIVVLGGVAIVYIGILLSTRMNNTTVVEMSSYQGGDAVMSGSWVNNLSTNIVAAFNKTRKLRISTMQIIPQLKFTFRICYASQVICVICLAIINRVYRNIYKIALLLITLISLPLAVSGISIVSPEFQYSLHHRSQWIFVICGIWMLSERVIERLWEESGTKKIMSKVLYWMVAIDMGLMTYGFILTDNIVYRAEHVVAEKDTALCTRIASVLDSDKNFRYDKNPVYVLNIVDAVYADDSASTLSGEPDLYNTITGDMDTNLWCYDDRSIRAHLSVYEGVDLIYPSPDIYDRIGQQWGKIVADHSYLKYGDFDVFRFEDTDTYVLVVKTVVSSGIVENR